MLILIYILVGCMLVINLYTPKKCNTYDNIVSKKEFTNPHFTVNNNLDIFIT